MSAILKAVDISHSFDYPLFKNFSIELERSQTTSVMGVSGSGKSTVLHILSSLLKPDSGEVIYEDEEIYSLNAEKLLKIRREHIGIIFQAHYLFRGFSARENIDIANILSQTDFDQNLVKELKIENILDQNVSTISGGQQQRVSIARVLSKKPKIIFADEPTGNLDDQTALEVMDTIFKYVKDNGASLFMVTHDQSLAKKCDRTYRLKDCGFELWS